jgi:VanZ family protein
MALIFYASSLSQVPAPPGGDKPWHLLAYLGLGVLVARAVAGGVSAPLDLRGAAAAIAIATPYAMTDEFHQMFVPGRSAQLSDLVADAIGVCIGVGICWAWGRMVKAQGARQKAQGTTHESQIAP